VSNTDEQDPFVGPVGRISGDRGENKCFTDKQNNLRAYSSAVVAHALGVDRRWLDSVIALDGVAGVQRDRQGVRRAISPDAVVTIAVAIELIDTLDIPLARALLLASSLLRQGGHHSPTDGMSVRIDIATIERRIAARLAEAVEAHPPPRRGRPPRVR
jgi:hypothetical protein